MSVLEIRDLKKGFRQPDKSFNLIVDVPFFALEPAGQIALEGESGSGKTTFLNLIAGILQADSGSVRIDAADMASLKEAGRDILRAKTIGYVFQTFNLLQGYTALENVLLGMTFGVGADKSKAASLLERVGLKERLSYYPRQLSVGQQQRVAVARALANKPKLVLADEPTGNLDHKRAQEALQLIREVCKETGAALLLVSHDRETLGQFEKLESLNRINHAQDIKS